jgi:hypothetical protein
MGRRIDIEADQLDNYAASGLNAVENFFSEMTRQLVRRGVPIDCRSAGCHQRLLSPAQCSTPKPFAWTKTAEAILAKLDRLPVSSGCVWASTSYFIA